MYAFSGAPTARGTKSHGVDGRPAEPGSAVASERTQGATPAGASAALDAYLGRHGIQASRQRVADQARESHSNGAGEERTTERLRGVGSRHATEGDGAGKAHRDANAQEGAHPSGKVLPGTRMPLPDSAHHDW